MSLFDFFFWIEFDFFFFGKKLFQTGTNSNIVVDPIESKKDQILRAGDKLRFLIQKSELEKVGVYATTLKNLKTVNHTTLPY